MTTDIVRYNRSQKATHATLVAESCDLIWGQNRRSAGSKERGPHLMSDIAVNGLDDAYFLGWSVKTQYGKEIGLHGAAGVLVRCTSGGEISVKPALISTEVNSSKSSIYRVEI